MQLYFINFLFLKKKELKFLSMYVQSVGIPFIIETDEKIKMFATDKEDDVSDFFDPFDRLKKIFENNNNVIE